MSAFVGRRAELEALSAVCERVRSRGEPSVGIILGTAGSGKSRLLTELPVRLGIRHLTMRGYEFEQQVPLAAAVDLLRALEKTVGDGGPAALLSASAPAHGLEHVALFERIHRSFPKDEPILLTIDDLQWVDSLTLALCHYLVRGANAAGTALLVIGASRASPAVSGFVASIRGLIGDDRLHALELAPLSQDEGVELVQSLVPGSTVHDAVSTWQKAAGSPFWIGILCSGGGGDAESDARQVVLSRIKGLSGESNSLMALTVLIAHPITLDDAAAVLDHGREQLEQAATHLRNRGMIVESERGLAPAHDLIRSAVTVSLPDELAKRLHERIALWLEATAGQDLPALTRALEHRRAAGRPALEAALRIARLPTRRLLGAEGLQGLLTIADEAASVSPDAFALKEELAALASELGERVLALERWAHLADSHPDPLGRARAALAASVAAFELQRAEDASNYLGRARELNPRDPVLELEIDVREALQLRWLQHELAEAKERTTHALAIARQMSARAGGLDALASSERRACLHALQAAFDVAVSEGDVPGMLQLADEMTSAAGTASEAHLRAALDGSLILLVRGELSKAEQRLRRVWIGAQKELLPSLASEAAYWLGWTLHNLGRLDEAAVVAQEATEVGSRVGIVPVRISLSWIRSLGPLIEVSRGGWHEAVAQLEAEADGEADPHYRLRLRWQRSLWLARLRCEDATERVQRDADDGFADAANVGCERCVAEFGPRIVEALARTGQVGQAVGAVASWEARDARVPPVQSFWRRRARAAVLVAQGELRAALDEMASLREQAGDFGLRIEQLWLDLDIGAALGPGEPDPAVARFQSVAEGARALGATTELSIATRELRALGVRTWRRPARERGSGRLGRLTQREREIARLVAGGATNPDIADVLFLSRKTVERHVSNILSKLEARNRTELASLVASEPADAARVEDGGAPR